MLGYASNTGLGFIRPESPTLAPEPPTGDGWIHEIKYDGYRTLMSSTEARSERSLAMAGPDQNIPRWSRRAPSCCSSALIDGEIIVQDEDSLSDFDALRSVIHKALHRCEPRLELNTITQPKH